MPTTLIRNAELAIAYDAAADTPKTPKPQNPCRKEEGGRREERGGRREE